MCKLLLDFAASAITSFNTWSLTFLKKTFLRFRELRVLEMYYTMNDLHFWKKNRFLMIRERFTVLTPGCTKPLAVCQLLYHCQLRYLRLLMNYTLTIPLFFFPVNKFRTSSIKSNIYYVSHVYVSDIRKGFK